MQPLNYLYVAGAIAFSMLLGTVVYQSNKIDSLEESNLLFKNKNVELVSKIDSQNIALRDGENNYIAVQRNLDIATGKNVALTTEFSKLRNSWKVPPVPKDCPSAVVELQIRSVEISDNWNSKK